MFDAKKIIIGLSAGGPIEEYEYEDVTNVESVDGEAMTFRCGSFQRTIVADKIVYIAVFAKKEH